MVKEFSATLAQYEGCTKCPDLCDNRTNIVWGYGIIHAPIMLVGEGPGAEEDRDGVPFVGNAGEKLWDMLKEAGISMDWVYTTNAVLCRPTQKTLDKDRVTNRKPTVAEVKNCRPRLFYEIEKIDPFIIVALGGSAIAALVGRETPVSKMIGRVLDVTILTYNGNEVRYPIVPCYHPSYFLKGSHAEDLYTHTVEALKFAKKIVDFAMGSG